MDVRYDIENIEPKEVLCWFKKICAIPHGSYHEEAISAWLTKTCKELGCSEVKQYPSGMILAKMPGTKGYENRTTVLLQGHMDMVLAKTEDCKKDLLKDPIEPIYDANRECIVAQSTTLGADNGAGVACMLALMANKEIPHGPLEFLFTVNEEDRPGLCVVNDLKPEDLKATVYINVDGYGTDTILHGAAGCITAVYNNPVNYVPAKKLIPLHLDVTGLRGGHSGAEIHIPHINAIVFLAETMLSFCKHNNTELNIVSISGGPINNAIPIFAKADFLLPEELVSKFEEHLRYAVSLAKKITQGCESNMKAKLNRMPQPFETMLSWEDTKRVLSSMALCPNKIFIPKKDWSSMYCSSNIGFVELNPTSKTYRVDFKVRSFDDEDVDRTAQKFEFFMNAFGWTKYELVGRCWSFINDPDANYVAQTWLFAYKHCTQKDVKLCTTAGGLELADVCKKKLGLMDNTISVGATVLQEHSPNEALPVLDLKIFWEVLKEALKRMN